METCRRSRNQWTHKLDGGEPSLTKTRFSGLLTLTTANYQGHCHSNHWFSLDSAYINPCVDLPNRSRRWIHILFQVTPTTLKSWWHIIAFFGLQGFWPSYYHSLMRTRLFSKYCWIGDCRYILAGTVVLWMTALCTGGHEWERQKNREKRQGRGIVNARESISWCPVELIPLSRILFFKRVNFELVVKKSLLLTSNNNKNTETCEIGLIYNKSFYNEILPKYVLF